jgi:2-C-methyl-D-erythritol 4-phosphate cytidylyltransferase
VIEGLGLVIVAAGSSTRMQGIDKVWATLGHHSVLWHSLNTLGAIAEHTVVVVHDQHRARAVAEFSSLDRVPTIVTGGLLRQESVARGLAMLPPVTIVAIHDAARPFAEPGLLFRGTELIQKCDGAVPGLRVTDTIKQVDERAGIIMTLDRDSLRSVQTPQVFRRHSLLEAHSSNRASSGTATDDASLLEACDYNVCVFPGQVGNFKITTEYDLKVARLLVADAMEP